MQPDPAIAAVAEIQVKHQGLRSGPKRAGLGGGQAEGETRSI